MPIHAPSPSSSARFSVAQSLLLSLVLALQAVPALASAPAIYAAERARFVDEMVARHGFERSAITALMSEARYQQAIIDAMNAPYEGKPWSDYRELFITPERIGAGRRFMAEHAALLQQAEAAYGVPPEIVTAIIGIETNYGETLGEHRVIDALSTLGFAYPRRADFFRKELESFLLLTREERLEPERVRGSYAGAVGKPQFIPSSYRAYAVDFDRDGRRDLWSSDADVIGSVGAYLARHGWRRGQPIAAPAMIDGALARGVEVGGKRPIEPRSSVSDLLAAGVDLVDAQAADTRAALIKLDGDGPEYWVTYPNFYAITRYNHSNLYALAAYQLSQAIAAEPTRLEDRDAPGD
jgi:membrane-bound lytic murein transglycosylase B